MASRDQPTPEQLAADPLLRLERNQQSTRNAIIYLLAVPAVCITLAVVLAFLSRSAGGPYCDRDSSAWLCSQSWILIWGLVPSAVALGGMFGAAWIAYRKWARQERWRPWIGVIWFLMPFALSWVTSTGALIINSH